MPIKQNKSLTMYLSATTNASDLSATKVQLYRARIKFKHHEWQNVVTGRIVTAELLLAGRAESLVLPRSCQPGMRAARSSLIPEQTGQSNRIYFFEGGHATGPH